LAGARDASSSGSSVSVSLMGLATRRTRRGGAFSAATPCPHVRRVRLPIALADLRGGVFSRLRARRVGRVVVVVADKGGVAHPLAACCRGSSFGPPRGGRVAGQARVSFPSWFLSRGGATLAACCVYTKHLAIEECSVPQNRAPCRGWSE